MYPKISRGFPQGIKKKRIPLKELTRASRIFRKKKSRDFPRASKLSKDIQSLLGRQEYPKIIRVSLGHQEHPKIIRVSLGHQEYLKMFGNFPGHQEYVMSRVC